MTRTYNGSTTTFLTLAGVEKEITVDYAYYPGCEAVMYLANGDPGYPAEAEEIEVTAIYFEVDGKQEDVTRFFTGEQLEAVGEAILEEGIDDGPDCED